MRSFAFVSDLVEITDLFAEHPIEDALSLVVSGLSNGGVLDTSADSDYGSALGALLEEYGGAVNRRTTVIVLGDGRGNGAGPEFLCDGGDFAPRPGGHLDHAGAVLFVEARLVRPAGYAAYCDRVHIIHDLAALEQVSVDDQGVMAQVHLRLSALRPSLHDPST